MMGEGGPRWPQEGPRYSQDGSKMGPRGPKIPPKRPKIALRRLQHGHPETRTWCSRLSAVQMLPNWAPLLLLILFAKCKATKLGQRKIRLALVLIPVGATLVMLLLLDFL